MFFLLVFLSVYLRAQGLNHYENHLRIQCEKLKLIRMHMLQALAP